jgi:sugar phosphate permease
MSLHQSGVYAGTIAGGALAGWIAQHYGWRSAFSWFGAAGVLLAGLISLTLREPKRGIADSAVVAGPAPRVPEIVRGVLASRLAWMLILAFIGANFVAVVFLSWMPSFLYRKFAMSLTMAGWSATAYLQTASVLGVLCGGIAADRFSRRFAGARPAIQCFGLLCGVPFLFLTGWTLSIPVLVVAMTCFGFFKGIYDANIFASLYEVVRIEVRAAAAGILNSLGWLGAGFAPVIVARAAENIGMSACLSATSVIYLVCAALLARAAFSQARQTTVTVLD